MTDTYHFFGSDITFSAAGDDLTADDALEVEQRVLRGLLTNPLDDPFNPTYGAGLGQYIGQALTPEKYAEVEAAVMSILMTEPDIQKTPLPTLNWSANNNSFVSVTIEYVYQPTGQVRTITAP